MHQTEHIAIPHDAPGDRRLTEPAWPIWPMSRRPDVGYGPPGSTYTCSMSGPADKVPVLPDLIRVPSTDHMVFWDDPVAGIGAVRDVLRSML